ncbi:sodium-coupled monocarboxylate transporter 2 [Halyomorpha halys]|uniref:sodium-coupled monocarboxylate transporter 2 n=1 Tax=Halyomorpha halys TaxID=286706 RepID=UPI0006D5214E|nr:sodium-coupled monocarboxylate transporter 2-like isoform X2 [Halyomorpha halys]
MAMTIVYFDWIEYLVFGLMLAVSGFIGVYFGFIKKEGQDTVDGYLLGGKEMTLFPVAMSLIASFISGIALLGIPSEVYRYGMNYLFVTLSYPTAGLVCSYVFLPVFFKLQQISVYQYMELRFNKFVRKMISFLFTISQIGLVPIVIYGPALALSQVSDYGVFTISFYLSAFCLFYTSIGGLKAVVWTDTVQGVVMYGAIFTIATLGTMKVGGISKILTTNYHGGRFDLIWDIDPRIRASVWSMTVGFMITNTATSAIHPSFVQRFISLRTVREARWSSLIFMSGSFIFAIFNMYMGLIVFTHFEKCDPLATGVIEKPDQILSYFIIHVFRDVRGLAGVFFAGLVSAALSTMSALLNTLAATVYEDFIEPITGKVSDSKAARMLKIITVAFGILCFLLVLVMEKLGSLLELYNSFSGPCAGVILGIFFLGVFFPQVNSKGAALGGIISLVAMCVLVYGSRMAVANGDLVYPMLPVSVEECTYNFTLVSNSTFAPTPVLDKVNPIFEITVYYYCLIGCVLAMILGIIISYLTGPNKLDQVDRDLLSPLVLRFLPKYTPVPVKETEMIKM